MDVLLTLYAAADGGIDLIGTGYGIQSRTPVSVKDHVIEKNLHIHQIDMVVLLILFQQTFIILLTDIVIRDTPNNQITTSPYDGQHTVIIEFKQPTDKDSFFNWIYEKNRL